MSEDDIRGVDIPYVTDKSEEVGNRTKELEREVKTLTDIVMSLNRDLLRSDRDHGRMIDKLKHQVSLLTILIFISWVAVVLLGIDAVRP